MIKKNFSALIVISMLIVGSVTCAAAELIIFHTNDMHSRIQDTDDGGRSIGLAKMAAAVKEVKAKNPATLWLDAGDTFHGMPLITISRGENLVPLLNEAGIDAMTAGNHDFNYGSAQLERLAKKIKFPLLDANVVRKSNGELLFKPYKIFKVNGIKVGVFGLSTPETAFKTSPKNIESVKFLNPVEVSKAMIKTLRPKCDVLIAVMHMGLDSSSEFTSERIARETDGIDLIVDGHSHTALADGLRIKDTLIVQAAYRVAEILIGGQPLDADKIYTIALADFLTEGGDNYTMLENLKIVGELGTFEEIFADYLNQVGMNGIEVGRIKRLVEVSAPAE